MKRFFLTLALLFPLFARGDGSWITGTLSNPAGVNLLGPMGTDTNVKISFTLQGPVTFPGQTVYRQAIIVTATNGIISPPQWLTAGFYNIQLGPFPDFFQRYIPGGSNTLNLDAILGTNSTTFGPAPFLLLSGGFMQGNLAWNTNATNAAFSPPVLTTAQRLAMNVTNGAIVYDSTLGEFIGFQDGAWGQIGGGGGAGSSFPLLLNPQSGLSYTMFLTNDDGIPTIQIGTTGYNVGTDVPAPLVFNAQNNLYYQLVVTNDMGILTPQFLPTGY
jgi:hypothetical protein